MLQKQNKEGLEKLVGHMNNIRTKKIENLQDGWENGREGVYKKMLSAFEQQKNLIS